MATVYDLPQIQQAGTLIGITLSGPDTYYEYRGQGFGLQFEMAEEFARQIGVSLQMELAVDSASLFSRLEAGEVDFVCMPMEGGGPWATREDTPLLTKAIAGWWDPHRADQMIRRSHQERVPQRRSRPVMQDRRHGVISAYDDLFVRHASAAGWDWRLLAAQCYQESGFDPQAVSWAGAQGLMQLMPATATQLGVTNVFDPEQNISGAARYIKQLNSAFQDIPDPTERIRFVLAAYNGGSFHVRDAMALTRKYGGDDRVWKHVAPYILRLSESHFYRDPVVKHGYMRGSETEGYVRSIMERWADYRGSARAASSASKPAPARRNVENGEYQSKVKSAEEFLH